jgi:hypothetical protein
LINIRAGDLFRIKHNDYSLLPLEFYREIIKNTNKIPVFMGELGDNFYTRLLLKSFPNAIFLPKGTVLQDFETIRRATNIVLSVSTFSWLAGWLSSAKFIHMPMCGILNPRQKISVDLIPRGDPRYIFYEFPIQRWNASEEYIDFLDSSEHFFKPTLHAD